MVGRVLLVKVFISCGKSADHPQPVVDVPECQLINTRSTTSCGPDRWARAAQLLVFGPTTQRSSQSKPVLLRSFDLRVESTSRLTATYYYSVFITTRSSLLLGLQRSVSLDLHYDFSVVESMSPLDALSSDCSPSICLDAATWFTMASRFQSVRHCTDLPGGRQLG